MNDRYDDKAQQDLGENEPLTTADMTRREEQTKTPNTESMMRTAGGSGVGQMTQLPLLKLDETESFHARWTTIQADFVDEPRRAVEKADGLVAELMQELASTFATEKDKLTGQWNRGEDVSTEDLRLALQRYRSFFDRLLSL